MITPDQIAGSGSEHGEQSALFAYAAIQARTHPLWALLFAIPNGGKRDKVTASRLKAEGVKSGVPDICLPVARAGYHSLYIELKRIGDKEQDRKPGIASTAQDRWISNLKNQQHCAVVCYGWHEAAAVVEWYLGKPHTRVYWQSGDV